MQISSLSKNVPVWALAVVLAVAAPGAPLVHAASHRANAELLASQLPNGGTLAAASMKDMKAAVRSAVAKRPADASDIVRIAILAKTPKHRAVDCPTVRAIVESAVRVAPDSARVISEMAEAMVPDCGQEIDRTVRGLGNGPAATRGNTTQGNAAVPGTTSGDGAAAAGDGAVNGADFGAGFGPGFPGSPSFGGSSPSGGFALPPTQNAVTPTVNG